MDNLFYVERPEKLLNWADEIYTAICEYAFHSEDWEEKEAVKEFEDSIEQLVKRHEYAVTVFKPAGTNEVSLRSHAGSTVDLFLLMSGLSVAIREAMKKLKPGVTRKGFVDGLLDMLRQDVLAEREEADEA